MKPIAFIAVSHGMHVRNLLNSQVFPTLRRSFDVIILSFPEDVPFLKAAYGGPGVEVVPFLTKVARWESRFEFVRRYVFGNTKRNGTINLFSMNTKRKRPALYRVLMTFNRVMGRWRTLRAGWLALEAAVYPGSEYDSLFRKYRPAILMTANYGTAPDEIRLIRAAKRAGVHTVSVVPSWDNLSSKGVIGAPPDELIVWNDIMRNEAVELHDYRPEQVVVCGGVQFDVYADLAGYPTREALCARFGMDPARKYVVYGTITPVYFPYNLRIVEMLADASLNGVFAEPIQVLVRLHPQVVHDAVYGDRIDDYRRVVDSFPGTVFINTPKVEAWGRLAPPHRDDGLLLGALLRHAAACVVPGSTLALDAVANGTPVVGIGFDGDHVLPYEMSIRRWYDFTYYKPLVDLCGLHVARSRDEMVALLRVMLADKDADAAEREQVVSAYLGTIDGNAGARIADRARIRMGSQVHEEFV